MTTTSAFARIGASNSQEPGSVHRCDCSIIVMTMRSLIIRLAAFSLPVLAGVAWGQPLPLEGIACAGFRVSDLERSRAYYTGRLGYQQAFELKNTSGTSAFFKVNEGQF